VEDSQKKRTRKAKRAGGCFSVGEARTCNERRSGGQGRCDICGIRPMITTALQRIVAQSIRSAMSAGEGMDVGKVVTGG